jgi:hypothetical protein
MQAQKTLRPGVVVLVLCVLVLGASCARHAGEEGESRVEVRGQYDVAVGHVHR